MRSTQPSTVTASTVPSPARTTAIVAPARLTSVDPYRGFVMFLMMAEVLRLSRVAQALPERILEIPGVAAEPRGMGRLFLARSLIAHLFDDFIHTNLTIHVGPGIFKIFGGAYEPLLHGTVTLFVMWLLLWMYRRTLFLKI